MHFGSELPKQKLSTSDLNFFSLENKINLGQNGTVCRQNVSALPLKIDENIRIGGFSSQPSP